MAYKMKGSAFYGHGNASPAKQAIELESDSANPGGVHGGESLFGKKRRKAKSQKNAIERTKGETALQAEGTKQAQLRAEERKANKASR